jgi:hypothetical protein
MRRQERKSLLEILLSRLRKSQAPPPAVSAPRPFQAVSIHCDLNACPMAQRLRDCRFLAKDAPKLPLTGCTHPNDCDCRYLKHKDRRSESRRLDFQIIRIDSGRERRRRPGRRATD